MSLLRDKISAAAQKLYLRDGIEGFSMRKVADMVGVSAPAIYRHYKNKDELLNEIVIEGLKILESYLRPALESGEPYDRLVRMTDSYLRFALEQPKYFDFAFLVPNPNSNAMADEIARPDWDTFRLAIEQVAACAEAGVFPKDDPLETAVTIWAEVHGLVTLFRTGRFGQDPELFRQIYRAAVDRMFRGLMALTDEGQPATPARP
jgi:AcrR family transcriptional regulator